MISRSFVIILIFSCLLAASVAIGTYINIFCKFPLSSNPEHWGQFGDYIGGVLNPIIGLATLVATCAIAISVQRLTQIQLKLQADTNKDQIKTQKILLLTQFRYELILKFQHQADTIFLRFDNIILAKNEKISSYEFHELNDSLKRLLRQIELIDQSLLVIDGELKKQILEAIEKIEQFDSSEWWGKNSKAEYLTIKYDTDVVIRSLLDQILINTRS